MRRLAVASVVAAALLTAGCGDGEDEPARTATTAPAAVEVTLGEARRAAVASASARRTQARNVLGGDEEIGRLLDRLDRDAALFYAETLDPSLGSPRVRREAGPCDGQTLTASDYPRWCSAEKTIFAPLEGAEKVRSELGAAPLYVIVGWAHAKAAAAGLGWEDKYDEQQLTQGRLCLFGAWFKYVKYQVVIETSDFGPAIETASSHPAFADAPGAEQAVLRDSEGVELCVR